MVAARNTASALEGLGVTHGTKVALMLPNCPAFVNAFFALSMVGAITVPVNTAYHGYMLEHVLNDTGCTTLVLDHQYLEQLLPSVPQLVKLERLILTNADSRMTSAGGLPVLAYQDLEEHDGAAFDPRGSFSDVNCILYTSGTTGPSKGVLIPNSLSVMKALEYVRVADIGSTDVIYAPLPLFHSFALLRGVMSAAVTGCTCVLRRRFSARSYWSDVRKHGATVGFVVSSMPGILAKAAPTDHDRDHPMRRMISVPYNPAFEQRFGLKTLESYGLTEAGLPIYGRIGDERRPGSCGQISEDWEVQLVDDLDLPVATGEVGEIVLRPKYPGLITPGYLNRPDATAAAFRNLWFHTGDLATMDEDGYYYFHARKKDAIRRRGENISAWELESVLREHRAVADAAALPYPSSLGEDDVRVVVERHAAESVTPEELIAFCTSRLPDFMVPRYVEFLDALPRTDTGKVEKYRLREEGLGLDAFDRGDPREAKHGRV
jgi:crotonobetaine/carnitine-CoA ligase